MIILVFLQKDSGDNKLRGLSNESNTSEKFDFNAVKSAVNFMHFRYQFGQEFNKNDNFYSHGVEQAKLGALIIAE